MLAIERQRNIANLVRQNGNVTISELVAQFQVSAETIRKDLLRLEQEGVLHRTHGGAVSVRTGSSLRPLSIRKQERVSQKAELCRCALQFIKNGDVIAIDGGSTALELAKLLSCTSLKLTVVTHSMEVFNVLGENSNLRLILCGGTFIREEAAFAGHLTMEAVGRVHTTKAFICPSGVSLEFGITDYLEAFIPIQSAYLQNTNQAFILADSEKFESTALFKISEARSDFTYITDSVLSDPIYDLYQENQIDIKRPGKAGR